MSETKLFLTVCKRLLSDITYTSGIQGLFQIYLIVEIFKQGFLSLVMDGSTVYIAVFGVPLKQAHRQVANHCMKIPIQSFETPFFSC